MKTLFVLTCSFLFFISSLCENVKNEDTEVMLTFVMFRHGERVPETNEQFPTDIYNNISKFWPMTYGEITKEGKQKQYDFGKKLRRRYNNLFGEVFEMNSVATYSTDWVRTKTSALLTLAGLFQPHSSQQWSQEINWQPIPIYSIPSKYDHLLQRPDPYCPRYVRELKKVFASEEVASITKNYSYLFKYVTRKSGRDIFDYHEMFRVFQNLYAKEMLNMTMPEWAKSIYPEPIHTVGAHQCLFENYTPLLRRLNGGHIVQKFIEYSRLKIGEQLKPAGRKMFLYSGHENNIVNILAVLGLYELHIPVYCSAVMLELHRNKATQEYGFKVFYENDTYSEGSHLLTIPGCDTFCRFDKFVEITRPMVPVNYTEECESPVDLDNYQVHL